ncbi:MAG: PqqD family protein [Thermodesulfobacteriota bacterium]|nr:PqqD family protein [Thermodesulfobacteriota bacterium]
MMTKRIIPKEVGLDLMLYDTEQDEVHVLNPTARLVYELYKKGRTMAEIEQEIRKSFQADDRHDLHGDVLRCSGELREKGLIGIDDC